MKQRLDDIDGIMTGLQGSMIKLMESTQEHRTNTDNALMKLTEITQKILVKVSENPSLHAKSDSKQSTNVREIIQVRDCVCQFQIVVAKKMQSFTEQLSSLEQQVIVSAETHEHVSSEVTTTLQ